LGHYTPLVGAPTVSLPIGQLPGGLPVGGIDIAGRPGDDRRILAIGAAISRVLPRIRPPQKIRPLPVDD
jgi:Asp-tRNA(Asn)/Glu-tRNA(Gln) amidotransferase A subunit family amidase